jgi:cell division protein FtsB
MLKMQLDSLDGLDESIQGLYKKDGDVFNLQVEGIEDTGELKRAYERVKADKAELKSQVSDLKTQLETSEENHRKALSSGEDTDQKIADLRTSYEDKFARLQSEKDEEVGSRDKFIKETLVDNKAIELASELAVEGSSRVLLPHLKSRLAVEAEGEGYKTVVLGIDGKPSAFTLDDLKTEFTNDSAFAHVIAGSKASGSDANQGKRGDAENGQSKTSSTTQNYVSQLNS